MTAARSARLVHASVCRDYLEPATACGVHHRLGLPADCMVYDVSNACLGLLNGIVQVANMIELGQIRAGLVVGTEGSRQLVETTVERLNADSSIDRNELKRAIASLTIGSGSAAVLLVHRDISRTQNRLLGGVARADTTHHDLCFSGRDESVAGDMRPLMDTDSERLMVEGIEAAAGTFQVFLREMGWSATDIDKTLCHQVGTTHRKLMFQALGLNPTIDFPTVETLGNTGSVALPLALALGVENGHLAAGASRGDAWALARGHQRDDASDAMAASVFAACDVPTCCRRSVWQPRSACLRNRLRAVSAGQAASCDAALNVTKPASQALPRSTSRLTAAAFLPAPFHWVFLVLRAHDRYRPQGRRQRTLATASASGSASPRPNNLQYWRLRQGRQDFPDRFERYDWRKFLKSQPTQRLETNLRKACTCSVRCASANNRPPRPPEDKQGEPATRGHALNGPTAPARRRTISLLPRQRQNRCGRKGTVPICSADCAQMASVPGGSAYRFC